MSYDSPASAPMQPTRINAQIEMVRGMVDRVERLTAQNVRHAQQLGFFPPPSKLNETSAPTPAITSLDDTISQLSRAIDGLEGSMNLFN